MVHTTVTEPPAHKTLLQDIAGVLGLGKTTVVRDPAVLPPGTIAQTVDVVPADATVVAHAPVIEKEAVTTVSEPATYIKDETTVIQEAARTEVEAASVVKEAPIIHEQAEIRERTVVHEKPIIHERPVVFEKDVIIEKPVVHEQDVITRIQPVVHEKHVIVEKPEIIEKPVVVEKPVLIEKHEIVQHPRIERLNTVIATEQPTIRTETATVITEPEVIRSEPVRVEVREMPIVQERISTVKVDGPVIATPQVTASGITVTTRTTPADVDLSQRLSTMSVAGKTADDVLLRTTPTVAATHGTVVKPAASVASGIAPTDIVADQPVGAPLLARTVPGVVTNDTQAVVSSAPGVIAETAVVRPAGTRVAQPL